VGFSNRAATVRALVRARLHAPVPLQEPVHPAKTNPELAAASSATVEPFAPLALQLDVQLPPGQLTVPEPGPVNVTLIGYVDGSSVAATVRSPSIVTLQVPVPLQEPPHRWNSELPSAAAESVTVVP
jgi:hypothetical protein